MMLLLIGNIGTGEIVVIALVVLLLFGGKKIPELMRSLGRGVKSFRDGVNEVETELKKDFEEPDSNKTSSTSSHPAGSSVPSSGQPADASDNVSAPSASHTEGSSDNASAPDASLSAPSSAPDEAQNASQTTLDK